MVVKAHVPDTTSICSLRLRDITGTEACPLFRRRFDIIDPFSQLTTHHARMCVCVVPVDANSRLAYGRRTATYSLGSCVHVETNNRRVFTFSNFRLKSDLVLFLIDLDLILIIIVKFL